MAFSLPQFWWWSRPRKVRDITVWWYGVRYLIYGLFQTLFSGQQKCTPPDLLVVRRQIARGCPLLNQLALFAFPYWILLTSDWNKTKQNKHTAYVIIAIFRHVMVEQIFRQNCGPCQIKTLCGNSWYNFGVMAEPCADISLPTISLPGISFYIFTPYKFAPKLFHSQPFQSRKGYI